MIIRKTQQPSDYPSNSISNAKTTGTTNTYSCDYINGIVESGSNSNGNWIKFVDGTMICYETFSIGGTTTDGQKDGSLWYVDINLQHRFAQKFISKPIIRINAYTSENADLHYLWVCTKYNSVTTSSFGNYRIYSPTNTAMLVSLDYIAIGKWK